MNIEKIIKVVERVAEEMYPSEPNVAKFCEKIILWERDNTSYTMPRYKEPYKRFLKEFIRTDSETEKSLERM